MGCNEMAKQPSEQHPERMMPSTTFSDLKKEIAERNERAQKEAHELRVARDRAEFGVVARHRLDLDR
jgi:hypothetical protein